MEGGEYHKDDPELNKPRQIKYLEKERHCKPRCENARPTWSTEAEGWCRPTGVVPDSDLKGSAFDELDMPLSPDPEDGGNWLDRSRL